MALADFEQLCEGFCDVAGLRVPALERDRHGALAFTALLDGVPVTLLGAAGPRPEAVFFMAEFGEMPGGDAAEGWGVLLDIERQRCGQGCAGFSRNPASGDVLMQAGITLQDLTAVDAYRQARAMADAALHWRGTRFLAGVEALPASCAAPGITDDRPMHAERVEGHSVRVWPIDPLAGEMAHVEIGISPASPDLSDELVRRALEANFALMTQADGAGYARNPQTHELVLQYAYPVPAVGSPVFRDAVGEALRFSLDLLGPLLAGPGEFHTSRRS